MENKFTDLQKQIQKQNTEIQKQNTDIQKQNTDIQKLNTEVQTLSQKQDTKFTNIQQTLASMENLMRKRSEEHHLN